MLLPQASSFRWLLTNRLVPFSVLVISLFALSISRVDADEVPSLKQIYRSYIESCGGYRHLESLHSLAIQGIYYLENDESVTVEIYRKTPGKIRIRKKFSNFIEELVFNGVEGCLIRSTLDGQQFELRRLDEKENASMLTSSSMKGLFYLLGQQPENVSSVSLDTVNGVSTYRIDFLSDIGLPCETIWLDVNTYLEIKVARQMEEDGSSLLEEIFFYELSEVDGHPVHFRQETYVDGKFNNRFELLSVRANAGIFNDYFEID